MACPFNTLQNITLSCEGSVGGLKRILIAHREDVSAITVSTADTKEITSIVMATGKHFVEYKFRRNTSSYTSTMTRDDAIGNSDVITEVNLQFSKAEVEKRLAIQSAINSDCVVILEDLYDQHIYLGFDNYVSVIEATMVSGTASNELNGFTMKLQDTARELPHFIDASFNVDSLKSA